MLSRSLRSSVSRRLGAIRTKGTTPVYPTMAWKKDTIVHKNYAATNADEAYFCGVKPGTPSEGWEVIYYGTWAIVIGISAMVYYSEDTTIQVSFIWRTKNIIFTFATIDTPMFVTFCMGVTHVIHVIAILCICQCVTHRLHISFHIHAHRLGRMRRRRYETSRRQMAWTLSTASGTTSSW